MVMQIYQSFGLKHLKLVINSIGDAESRKEYNEALVKHFEPVIDDFVLIVNHVYTRINENIRL